jgi:hypothetical protein
MASPVIFWRNDALARLTENGQMVCNRRHTTRKRLKEAHARAPESLASPSGATFVGKARRSAPDRPHIDDDRRAVAADDRLGGPGRNRDASAAPIPTTPTANEKLIPEAVESRSD